MKRIIACMLALVMMLSLAGCAGSVKSSPEMKQYIGDYSAKSVITIGSVNPVENYFPNGFDMMLREKNKGSLSAGETVYDVTWTVLDNKFYLKIEEETYTGDLRDGCIVIEGIAGEGTKTVMANKANSDQAKLDEIIAEYAPAAPGEWWDGVWYGWLVYDNAQGAYADWQSKTHDVVCQVLSLDSFGMMTFSWAQEDPSVPFATITGHYEQGRSDIAKFVADDVDGTEDLMGAEHIVVDPALTSVSSVPHMIEITGSSSSESTDEDYYQFYIYLRPWGDSWDDLKETPAGKYRYKNMMPSNYDWYTEMVQQKLDPMKEFETKSMKDAAKKHARSVLGSWSASGFVYTFKKDGTGVYSYGSGEMKFKYTVDKDTLQLTYENEAEPITTVFSVNGNEMTIRDPLGVDITYTKVVEETAAEATATPAPAESPEATPAG